MLSEITQPEKNKYCMISLIREIRKYNQLVDMTEKKQSHREQNSDYQGRGRREGQERAGGLGGTEQ